MLNSVRIGCRRRNSRERVRKPSSKRSSTPSGDFSRVRVERSDGPQLDDSEKETGEASIAVQQKVAFDEMD